MYDLTRFLVILMLFVAGFTLHVTSIFQVWKIGKILILRIWTQNPDNCLTGMKKFL